MAPIFSKNAILVGMVDCFCLACETYLKSDKDTKLHIAKPVHVKNVEAIQYVDEFKTDGIKKIKNKYFCELCNKLLTVLARVRLHICEQTHINNKNFSSLKRIGNSIIAFDKVLICDQSWNGLNENSCAICNIEYENEEIHKKQSTHILNIIQIQVEFDKDQNIYRKIDEVSFHCLTCNMVLGLNSLTSHFTGEEHKKLYKACCNAYTKIFHKEAKTNPDLNKAPIEQVTSTEPTLLHNEKKSDVLIQKPETITQKPLKNNPTCEKSQKEKVKVQTAPASEVNNKKSGEETKINKENKTKYVCDDADESKICNILGCTNYVTIDEHNKTWCILCDWVMPCNNVKKHASGKHHQAILKLHKLRLQKKGEYFEILGKSNEWQKYDIIVNSESNTVFCKKCDKYLEFVYRTIESHIMEHKKKSVMKEGKSKYFDSSNESEVKNNLNNNDDDDKDIKKLNESNDDILENVNELQKQDINVNFESSTAFCKKCNTHIEFVYKAIRSHILEHKQKPVKKSKIKEIDSIPTKICDTKNLATSPVFLQHSDKNDQHDEEIENSIKNKGTNEIKDDEIGTVQIRVSIKTSEFLEVQSPKNDKENISKNAESKSTKVSQGLIPKIKKMKEISLVKVPIKVFLYNVMAIEYLMFKDIIINDKYCINFLCFLYLVQMGQEFFRCHICKECFHGNEFDSHCDQPKHATGMVDTPVILNDDSEFIREIHPNTFLCGFCNLVEESWESMDGHLKTSVHKECKIAGIWRKELYQTKMDNDDVERIICDNFAMDAIIHRFL